nr:cytochrome P450 [Nocardioides sp. zg-DK7169]
MRWGLNHALPRGAMTLAARGGDLHSRLVVGIGPDGEDFWRLAEEVRRAGPLPRSRFAHVTASHAVVREVLASPDFRAGVAVGPGGPLGRLAAWAQADAPMGPLSPPSLLVSEPPDHTRYRRLVTRVFSVRAVQDLTERTREIAERLADDLERRSRTEPTLDLVPAYCALLPVTVIAEILGVPAHERDVVLRLGSAAAPSLDLGLSWSRFRAVEAALRDFERWLTHHLEQVRRAPGEDLLSQLVAAQHDDGSGGLTDAELRSTAGLVLAAGFETTVNLLGNGVALLGAHPEQRALLAEEPERWPDAVDEVLRLDPPVLLTGRVATRDTVVAGVPVPGGSVVAALLAAANRDPEVFADPARFDVTRSSARDHVSFSSGRHYCLGAALARMEGHVGLETLHRRFPALAVEAGGRRRPTRILRGYDVLRVSPRAGCVPGAPAR